MSKAKAGGKGKGRWARQRQVGKAKAGGQGKGRSARQGIGRQTKGGWVKKLPLSQPLLSRVVSLQKGTNPPAEGNQPR